MPSAADPNAGTTCPPLALTAPNTLSGSPGTPYTGVPGSTFPTFDARCSQRSWEDLGIRGLPVRTGSSLEASRLTPRASTDAPSHGAGSGGIRARCGTKAGDRGATGQLAYSLTPCPRGTGSSRLCWSAYRGLPVSQLVARPRGDKGMAYPPTPTTTRLSGRAGPPGLGASRSWPHPPLSDPQVQKGRSSNSHVSLKRILSRLAREGNITHWRLTRCIRRQPKRSRTSRRSLP
jgi:hypothetical protein